MTRWARVNDLFHAARARPLSDRDAFLALECGGDGVLRAEVESLLAAHDVNPASVTSSGVTVGSRVGDYEITGFLAAGAMGEVYRARDSKLGRDVALKILPAAFMADSDRCARFEREARALAALNHPNIATIYGFVESTSAASGQSVSALALELVEGETLADRIARGRLPVDAALRIARQIAEALEAAHEQGIIHRDLKPANIKLTRDGVVKVLDFGLAKLSSPDDTTTATSPSVTGAGVKTGAGVLLGTPAYMSPEQARGETVDKRTDIWAFGCVLFELLTGRAVFEGQGVSDTLATVLKTEPDWKTLPTDVPRLITALIESCLQKDRSRRLRDMAAARFALESQAVGRPAGDSTPVASKAWRRVITAAATAVVVWALVFMTARSTSPVALSPVSTFRVALGEGQRFTNLGRLVIAISPDGSRIVYVANDRLYTRRMSELDATPIAGTEGFGMVTSPAFSPDGTSVVFYAEGSLKRITVTGGRAVTIAPASNPHGVSWEGETILFGQQGTGIVAVPAHGGQPEVEVKASPEETADSPQLLPGVNAILFSVTKAAGINRWDEADIVVYSRDSQQRKVVIRGGSAARYVPSGHILYAVQDSLMAVPFDLERLDVTGSPVPVLEKVLRSGAGFTDTAQLDVSGNGTLTYIPAAAVLRRTLVWVDRQGREELVKSEPREFGDAQLSPDGQRVAIQIDNDVWTFDLARGALTRLTFEAEEDETPMWAPDGSWIAYASTDGGRPTVFRRRADGTGPRERVWSAPEPQMHTHVSDWTPNGRTLVISHDAPLGSDGTQVSLIEFDDDRTTTSLLRSRFNNNTGRVSPDGRWIAYRSDESGRYEVYVQPFPSLEGKWQISTGGGQQPLWSAKGDELFYRGEGAVMAVRVSSGASFSAGPPQKLFDDHYVAARGADRVHYDVSSDGRRFLMVKEDASFPQASVAPHFVVVENWFQELKRLVPTN